MQEDKYIETTTLRIWGETVSQQILPAPTSSSVEMRVPMDARLLLYHRFTLGHVLPFVSHVLHYKQRFSSLVSYDRLH